ncbi:MAG TPA: NADPH-dependent F420 reductase [Solirubrobacteraceae bacterium]|nr:NADPH-dependent F420 reductase [Solirubrobacteraceae bacterium]
MAEGVSIIGGTGALGFGLAVRLSAAGVPVVIGSRDHARAQEAAERAREKFPSGTCEGQLNEHAARESEVVFLCVPLRNQVENLVNLREHLREGQILVDATVPLAAPLGGKATRTIGIWQGSCAQQAQEMVPDGVRVVSALHTVAGPVLQDLDARFEEDVLVCGAKRDDKRRVAGIIEKIEGLRCVDAGPLEMARLVEPLTALLIGINGRYKTHAGIRVTGLPEGDLFPPLKKR